MKPQVEAMSIESAFAWLAGALAAVVAAAVLSPGLNESQVIALSTQLLPLAA